jgi:hypothetical protein
LPLVVLDLSIQEQVPGNSLLGWFRSVFMGATGLRDLGHPWSLYSET